MTETKDHLLEWLRDAHAMEQQAEQMLTAQARRLENYPELRTRIEEHIDETRTQADRLETCIQRLGGTTSSIKDAGGRMMAMAQGIGGMFTGDEVVKGAMAGYTFEHFEIASYEALAATADALGDRETKEVCETILREEQRMADWLREHLRPTTARYLDRAETPGAAAKR